MLLLLLLLLLLLWLWLLILSAPLNHKGRTQALRSGYPGMDAGIAALGHGWPFAAGPRSNACVREHLALARCPVVGRGAFGYFWRLFKSDPP
ncbi:hypothetical protein BIV09_11765 [Pseudomonas sp. 7SR1]|nr:hypothetical protein BIV09_11765 [Pseudomonas sp. 7SR1]